MSSSPGHWVAPLTGCWSFRGHTTLATLPLDPEQSTPKAQTRFWLELTLLESKGCHFDSNSNLLYLSGQKLWLGLVSSGWKHHPRPKSPKNNQKRTTKAEGTQKEEKNEGHVQRHKLLFDPGLFLSIVTLSYSMREQQLCGERYTTRQNITHPPNLRNIEKHQEKCTGLFRQIPPKLKRI